MERREQKLDKSATWKMFNRLAPKYDFINRVLSFGIDLSWRKMLKKYLPPGDNLYLLDLATGTGDQLFALCTEPTPIGRAVGLDPAEKMLNVAKEKLKDFDSGVEIEFAVADATAIPYPDETFDVVSMAFGIRNVPDYRKALSEIYRVLKRGGKALILESTVPKLLGWRELYLFYLRNILPTVGGVLSGDKDAYIYLDRSVEEFPAREEFVEAMRDTGFLFSKYKTISGGIAIIYTGEK